MDLEKTLDEIESDKPEVGIGAAAATAGILATSLIIKIANKSKLTNLQAECKAVKSRFGSLADADKKAYKDYMAAFKAKDKLAEETALKYATGTPFMIGENAYKLIELAETALYLGKKSMALEAYGAACLGEAALKSTLEIVDANMAYLKDQTFISKTKNEKRYLIYKSRIKIRIIEKAGNFNKSY